MEDETSTSYTDSFASPGKPDTTYRYAIRSYRYDGTSAETNSRSDSSNVAAVTTPARPKPPAPSSLSVTSSSSTAVVLGWTAAPAVTDGNGAITAYEIYRCDGGGTTACSTYLAFVSDAAATSYTDSFASPGKPDTTYRYAIKSYRYDGTSAETNSHSDSSNVVAVTTPARPKPPAPSSLEITSSSSTAVVLGWTAAPAVTDGNGPITAYEIYRCDGGGSAACDTSLAFVSDAAATSYTDSFASPGKPDTTYRYAIKSYRYDGTSAETNSHSDSSNVVAVTTPARPKPPAPSSLEITSSSSTAVVLGWTAAPAVTDGNGPITAYEIYRCDGGGTTACSTYLAFVSDAAAASYTDSTVSPATTYRYAIRSYRYDGTSAETNSHSDSSNVVAVTTPARPKPPAPSSLEITSSSSTAVVLGWTAAPAVTDGNGPITAYEIYRCDGGGSAACDTSLAFVSDAAATSYTDSFASPGKPDTTYRYAIKSYRYDGTSAETNSHSDSSNVVAVTTPARPKPPAPSSLEITSSSSTAVVLGWTAAPAVTDGNGPITAYEIYRCDGGGTTACDTSLVFVSDAAAASYSDSTVSPATTYRYAIRSYRYDGTSAEANSHSDSSNVVVVTTPARPKPPAPSSLSVTSSSGTWIVLGWTTPTVTDGNGAITAYEIYRCDGGGSAACDTSLVFVSDAAAASYSDSTVSPVTTYRYAIRSYRYDGTSAEANSYSDSSNVAAVTTPARPKPPAPSSLEITSSSNTSVVLGWTTPTVTDGNGPITAYEIYRCDGGGTTACDTSLVFVSDAAATSYTDTTVSPATTYRYAIRSYRYDGTSAEANSYSDSSNVAAVTTPARSKPPAPSSLSVTSSSSTAVVLGWTTPTVTDGNGAITAYQIYRCKRVGSAACDTRLHWESDAAATSYTDTTVSPATTYRYAIRSYRYDGSSTEDNSYSVSSNQVITSAGVVKVTQFKVAAISSDSISLSWKPSIRNVERDYSVYRCTVPEDETTCDPYDGLWLAALGNAHAYTDTEVTPGETYRYAVAVEPFTREELSRAITVTAQMMEMPAAPTGLMVTETGHNYIKLSWTAPEDDGRGPIDVIDIYRCNIDRTPDCSQFLHLASRNPALTEYKDKNLEPDTTYRYAVASYRSTGEVRPWSNQVTASTQSLAPGAPTGLIISATSTGIRLSWNMPAGDIIAAYSVYRCEEGETPCTPESYDWVANPGDTPPAPTEYFDEDVTPGTTYRYVVVSNDRSYRQSDWSDEVTATAGEVTATDEMSSAPIGLTVTDTSETAISLSWTAPADGILGYSVHRCRMPKGKTTCNLQWYAWVANEGDAPPAPTSYTDTGGETGEVIEGATYLYAVSASYPPDYTASELSETVIALAQIPFAALGG